MGKNTKISWADDSVNLWWGCVQVGPGCDHCYAMEFSKRLGKDLWGVDAAREEKPNAMRTLDNLENLAHFEGRRRRVFVNSMSDLAEILPTDHPSFSMIFRARANFFSAVHAGCYDHLDLIWLTKRIGNVKKLVPDLWMRGYWPSNLWIVPTICTQAEADRDIPKLLEIPAAVRGLSCEPLLEEIDITPWLWISPHCARTCTEPETCDGSCAEPGQMLHWCIIGGESGPHARPFVCGWGKDLIRQCKAAGVPVFFKQLGSNPTNREGVRHPAKAHHGTDPSEWPEEMRVQQFPKTPYA